MHKGRRYPTEWRALPFYDFANANPNLPALHYKWTVNGWSWPGGFTGVPNSTGILHWQQSLRTADWGYWSGNAGTGDWANLVINLGINTWNNTGTFFDCFIYWFGVLQEHNPFYKDNAWAEFDHINVPVMVLEPGATVAINYVSPPAITFDFVPYP